MYLDFKYIDNAIVYRILCRDKTNRKMNTQNFVYNDGGRSEAGFKGTTGDCVTRAISIATERDYSTVYKELTAYNEEYSQNRRNRVAKSIVKKGVSPRNGVHKPIIREYLTKQGWEWHPTMLVGQGCKVHLIASELPAGRLIVNVSRHTVAVIDGVVHDTYDCTREGKRCVYGYYTKK